MALLLFVCAAWTAPAGAAGLSESLGRNEVRLYSTRFRPALGQSVAKIGLAERLSRLGYDRVRSRPSHPGEFFWGHSVFWMYVRDGHGSRSELVGWRLAPADGRILGFLTGPDAEESRDPLDAPALEAEVLATSFDERRAVHAWVPLTELPEHVWRALLAIEDARFFNHSGVDGRAVARALLANVKSGGVVQGGSTITQQLVKLRDLSPKRSLGRKASEALRSLALEAEYTKEEILEAYLNLVYYGHVEGLALYGIDAAARAYFSTAARDLTLAQGAALAALVQGPNRLTPLRHPERLASRFGIVLDKLAEHQWADATAIEQARRAGLPPVRSSSLRAEIGHAFRDWVGELSGRAGSESRPGGVLIDTTLDPYLQELANESMRRGLERLRSRSPSLHDKPLSGALVALDAVSGEVVAYVGGDPAKEDAFDRARLGRRQPGSTVKPFVVLEALESCGGHRPLFSSRRIEDAPLTIELESGDWSPQNADRRFRGTVSIRDALTQSLNVPMVRLARHCGFKATAGRLRRSGLEVPRSAPPALVLGAIETSPLGLAGAYSLFANGGRINKPQAIRQARRRGSWRLFRGGGGSRRASSAAAAYLVFEQLGLSDVGPSAFGKTGTSSNRRDAWFAGGSGRLITVVWVGLDDGQSLGYGGSGAAEPIWREFVSRAAPSLPAHEISRPVSIVEDWIDPDSGLRLRKHRDGAELYLFDASHRPPVRRFWRRQSPLATIR